MILIRNQENLKRYLFVTCVENTLKIMMICSLRKLVKEMKGFITSIVIPFIIDLSLFTEKIFHRWVWMKLIGELDRATLFKCPCLILKEQNSVVQRLFQTFRSLSGDY